MMKTTSLLAVVLLLSFGSALVALAQTPLASSPKCVVPPNGLISWWTGDVDETDLYGVNNPSAVNAVTLVLGEVLDGFTFGGGGYIDIPASTSLANKKFTWAAWAEPDGPGPNNDEWGSVIIDQPINDVDVSVELEWRANPDYRFRLNFGDESETIISNDTFPPGMFYFVAGTYDGATFRLYVNGVLEGSYAEKKTIGYSANTWEIGSTDAAIRGTGYPRTWNGVIDEVQAFNTDIPAAKILAIYRAGHAGMCKAPVVVTPASETFASRTVDTTSPAKTVMILNNRDVTLTIDPFTFGGADPLDFDDPSTTCGGTLAARKTCKVSITFTPTETGKRSAILDVNDSTAGSQQTVNLSGTGK
ncbi:MAG: LamG-like jellyroll fold domain-containing protein [Terriglobales bacterium]